MLLADNRDLYQRYLELAQLQGYQETARPSYLAPIRFLPAELRALFLVNVSLRLQTGSLAQRRDALADLQNDLRLWRRVLTGDGRFEYKMVAVASLQGDYLLLADMIADPRTDLAAVSPDVQSLVPVFELGDWSIPRAFTAQYRAFSSDWVQTRYMYSGEWKPAPSSGDTPPRFWRSLGRAVESHYFQFNSTENLAAEQMDQLMAVARAAPSQFYALRDLAQNWERDNLTPYSVGGSYDPASYVYEAHGIFGRWLHRHLNMISAPVIFNPVGKVLVANSLAANLPDFSLRAYDGAALQRLVKLGYEIRRRQLGPSSIPAFLQQHPEWATHPVSGRPFLWNAGSSEIAVQTVARQRAGSRFTVHV
ncbi:MAG TPA: hypothetical protein VGV09_19220, partial [Steroidobacteraceae bacterium]|nr:hypothetical protein [Steroidobacteraceae bacterium]